MASELPDVTSYVSIKGCGWLLHDANLPLFLSSKRVPVRIHFERNVVGHSVNYQDIVFSILFLCPVEYRKMEERRFFCVPVVASRGGTGLRRASTGQYLPFTQHNLCSQTFQSATWALPVEISQHIPSSNLDHRRQHMDVLRLLTTDNTNKYTER